LHVELLRQVAGELRGFPEHFAESVLLAAFHREHAVRKATGLPVEIRQRPWAAREDPARCAIDLDGHHFERSTRRSQCRPDRINAGYVDPLR
jgi:hypothetical protein